MDRKQSMYASQAEKPCVSQVVGAAAAAGKTMSAAKIMSSFAKDKAKEDAFET
jgi:hypothetical protein